MLHADEAGREMICAVSTFRMLQSDGFLRRSPTTGSARSEYVRTGPAERTEATITLLPTRYDLVVFERSTEPQVRRGSAFPGLLRSSRGRGL